MIPVFPVDVGSLLCLSIKMLQAISISSGFGTLPSNRGWFLHFHIVQSHSNGAVKAGVEVFILPLCSAANVQASDRYN